MRRRDMSRPRVPEDSPVLWDENHTPRSRHFGDTYRSIWVHKVLPQDSQPASTTVKVPGHVQCTDLGLAQSRSVFLQGTGLLQALPVWRHKSHWSILETGFGLGLNFLSTWAHWRSLSADNRPRRFTFVSTEIHPVQASDVLRSAAPWPELQDVAQALHAQWFGLTKGFHRLSFEDGAVTLILCIGDVQRSLNQLSMQADSIFLDGFSPKVNPQMWSHQLLGRVARLAAPSARVASWCVSKAVITSLQIHGFDCHKQPGIGPKRHRLEAVKSGANATMADMPNSSVPMGGQRIKRCAVIGAGLAGVCAASAMAQRGWRVCIFDQNASPAGGASGVPLATFSTQLSADDDHASKLSRAALRCTLSLLETWGSGFRDMHWSADGVWELKTQNDPLAPLSRKASGPWSARLNAAANVVSIFNDPFCADWYEPVSAAHVHASIAPTNTDSKHREGIKHQRGGWAVPSVLIEERLKKGDMEFRGNTPIHRIFNASNLTQSTHCTDSPAQSPQWHLESSADPSLCDQVWDHVIVANAGGATELLAPLGIAPYSATQMPILERTFGQLSTGLIPAPLTHAWVNFPLIGSGSFMTLPPLEKVATTHLASDNQTPTAPTPHTPSVLHKRWFAGSTFERVVESNSDYSATHNSIDPSGAAQALPTERVKHSEQIKHSDQAKPYHPAQHTAQAPRHAQAAQFIKPSQSEESIAAGHKVNFRNLARLYPAAHHAITNLINRNDPSASAQASPLQAWSQWRCNTRNRVPWVQDFCATARAPKHLEGISVLTGLGAKGLTLAPMCAEILACAIHQEPCPVELNLRKAMLKIEF